MLESDSIHTFQVVKISPIKRFQLTSEKGKKRKNMNKNGNEEIIHEKNEYMSISNFEIFQWIIFLYKINTSKNVIFIKLKPFSIIVIIIFI